MKILVVTEKCGPQEAERDGGARLVETLRHAFGSNLKIMQFGQEAHSSSSWHFKYPYLHANRFERRVVNGPFIASKVREVADNFTHIFFIHISMQFGWVQFPPDFEIWTFPMFLTPSYIASGEIVPAHYQRLENLALSQSTHILTPSHMEKAQLLQHYAISAKKIHLVPRGIATSLLTHQVRYLEGPPQFCSLGSIKPQKNTLGLVNLFDKIRTRYPGATLRIVGPIQNEAYYTRVLKEIANLNLQKEIELTGYISPHEIPKTVQDAHLHISASLCETFGRSIFETLALGLPNLARFSENAAHYFLGHLPYACFEDEEEKALVRIDYMLKHLPQLSKMTQEIGKFYDDQCLSSLLSAKISKRPTLAISDFDGTLYHKNNPSKSFECIQAFQKYSCKVLCSARPLEDLLRQLKNLNFTVDWIIAFSGALVATGKGEVLWSKPLTEDNILLIKKCIPQAQPISINNQILQFTCSASSITNMLGVRCEIYQKQAYLSNWEASKFSAAHKLLRCINWTGQVQAFGDGPYDQELLTYFDGIKENTNE